MKIIISYLFVSILLFTSCEEKGPNAPQEETPVEVLAQATIGSEGGELASDGFTLTVPKGAFITATEIKLYKEPENKIEGTKVSKNFRIEGIPNDFQNPLELKLKYEGTLLNKSFIAIGEDIFIRALDKIKSVYNLIQAKDSAGYLFAKIPVPEVEQGISKTFSLNKINLDTKLSLSVSALTNCSTYPLEGSSNSSMGTNKMESKYHFLIKVAEPNVLSENVQQLLESLESAYNKFSLELGFKYNERTNWPVIVNVLKLDESVFGYYTDSYWGNNYGYLEFNSSKIFNLDELKRTAGHEFFHLVQSLYDHRGSVAKARGWDYLHYWLDEATAVCVEAMFLDDLTEWYSYSYSSSIIATHEMRIFDGIQQGVENGAKEHGYAMSEFIKYIRAITDPYLSFHTSVLIPIYDKIKTGEHPVKAVIDVSGCLPPICLEEFFRACILGTLNTLGTGSAFWSQNMHDTFKIDDPTDRLKLFAFDYPQLSARLYKIQLMDSTLEETDQMNFKLLGSGVSEITLLKYKQGNIEFIENSNQEITIENIRNEYVNSGSYLYALVTNSAYAFPYTGTDEITLQIKIEQSSMNYKEVALNLKFAATFLYEEGNTIIDTIEWESPHSWDSWAQIEGSFSGNTFTETISGLYDGTITVVFSENRDTILTYRENLVYESSTSREEREIVVFNIPQVSTNQYKIINGQQTCGNVLSIKNESTNSLSNYSLINYNCIDASELVIIFYD